MNHNYPYNISEATRLDSRGIFARDKTYFVKNHQQECILKLFGHPKLAYRRFLVNKVLTIHNTYEFKGFRLPKVLSTDYKNWVSFEALKSKPDCQIPDKDRKQLISGLLHRKPPDNPDEIHDPYSMLLLRMLHRLFYQPIPMNFSERLCIARNLMYCYYLQPEIERPVFVHTDLHSDNILKTDSGIYLLDLLSAVFDTRWVLADTLVNTLVRSGFNYDSSIIQFAMNESSSIFPNSKFNWTAQLYIGLMYYLLKILGPRIFRNQIPHLLSFIREHMLHWKTFTTYADQRLS